MTLRDHGILILRRAGSLGDGAGSAPRTRGCGVLKAKDSWGGCTGVEGGGGGDLLRHLLRGRKDHMMRVKVRLRYLGFVLLMIVF